jgi:acetyl esterase
MKPGAKGGGACDAELAASEGTAPGRPYRPWPEIELFLEKANRLGNDLDDLTREKLAMARAVREVLAQHCLWHIPVESVVELRIAGAEHVVRARLYVPEDKQLQRDGKMPVLVYFHGGGWTLGSPAVFDSVTRELARKIPALVIAPEYRLAPENPFPAAVNDADTVLAWARQHAGTIGGDPERIVVAGDSAGGTLAIVSALHAHAAGGTPPAMQVLFYPSTNISSVDYDSYREYGKDYLLTQRAVERFREFYLPRASDWVLPEASPLLADDLSFMPPALVIGAGCDPLRDEGRAYALKLGNQGVKVTYHLERGLIHAFLNLYNLDSSCSAYVEGVLGFAAGMVREAVRPRLL